MNVDDDGRRGRYVPALGLHSLTRFYDPVVRASLKEDKFKRLLIQQADIKPGQRVLDLGCGTGTLTIMLKRACPDATVVGLDGDRKALAIAKRKIAAASLGIGLHQAMSFAPPFAPGSFDRVVSSLLFHHLAREDKRRTLKSLGELLRPGGELHIADWGRPRNALMRVAFLVVQLLDGFDTTQDNAQGRLVEFMEDAGFASVTETHSEMTLLGTLSLYRASVPP